MHKLLIVDDEPIITDSLALLFAQTKSLNLNVFHCYSAMEALVYMEKEIFDIVLTDVNMPVMNGIELQERIYAINDDCKVIFLSGYDDFSYIQQSFRKGALDYILKTEQDETILQSVKTAIHKLEKERVQREIYKKAVPPVIPDTKKDARLVSDIEKFIADNLDKDISLMMIADHFRFNPSYISRRYKELTNHCLLDAINERKLKRAIELLSKGRLKIKQVGQAIGFESPSYFTNFFKKHTGISPKDYIKCTQK